ncbi:MAG TPA: hypothetical protein VGE27_15185 [Gemmatimonas sp.]|uniref:hypothetical protein n=1 Tax=Gemmatimonas sp. TaxID=1962908 RepID=UPI002ED9BA6E
MTRRLMRSLRRRTFLARTLPVAVLLAACGGSEATDPTVNPPGLQVAGMVVEDVASGEVMFSHDAHWHGFPIVNVGARRELRVYFITQGRSADDHDVPPRSEWQSLENRTDYSVPVVIEDPSRARWDGDRRGGTLTGQAAGASRMTFRVLRGTTTIWEAPSLNFTVRP